MSIRKDSASMISTAYLNYTWYCLCGMMCRDDNEVCPKCNGERKKAFWDARKRPRQ
jgi:rubrerythrin